MRRLPSRYIVAILFVILIILLVLITNYFLVKDKSPADRGTLGDMFGGINALFTGFGFVGVILTVLLQSETMKREKFERTFFHLTKLYHQQISGHSDKNHFKIQYNILKEKIKGQTTKDNVLALCREHFDEHSEIYVPYYTKLYAIIDHIREAKLHKDDEYHYFKILRAQFSYFEQYLLFYQCISMSIYKNPKRKNENLKKIFEKNSLFDNLDTKEINEVIKNEFKKEAFQGKSLRN
jgi:hypothetical protein